MRDHAADGFMEDVTVPVTSQGRSFPDDAYL